jgi:hypothetical protein
MIPMILGDRELTVGEISATENYNSRAAAVSAAKIA